MRRMELVVLEDVAFVLHAFFVGLQRAVAPGVLLQLGPLLLGVSLEGKRLVPLRRNGFADGPTGSYVALELVFGCALRFLPLVLR